MEKQAKSSRSFFAFALAAVLVAAALSAAPTQSAHAASVGGTPLTVAGSALSTQSGDVSITKGALTVSRLEDFGGVSAMTFENGGQCFLIPIHNESYATITVTSTDPSLVEVLDGDDSFDLSPGEYRTISCNALGTGKASVRISNGTDTIEVPTVAYPCDAAPIVSISKASYKTAKLTWKPVSGVDGYEIKRAMTTGYYLKESDYNTVATVKGSSTATAVASAPWDIEYTYSVAPYLEYAGHRFSAFDLQNGEANFTLPKASVRIDSVKKASPKGLKLAWTADAGATGYTVYRSAYENRGYKKIATTANTTYTDKKAKKRGVMYYYRVRAAYPGYGSSDSHSYAQMVKKNSKASRKTVTITRKYGSYYLHSSQTYCYRQGSKTYAVCYTGSALKVIGFNAKMKKVSCKTVKLPKHDCWGGVFHGPDGNNYVAIGYRNPKESKTKTVIKVIKYSSKWKKGKTAAIKGGAGNGGGGIYSPFELGTASMDMQDSTLYLFTGREAFVMFDDGLHHQSNIGFRINTKSMKAKEDNLVFTSHSLGQRVRFKDGAIFLSEAGDLFRRGICLTWQEGYGTKSATKNFKVPFPFMGEGSSSPHASMKGMEVGKDNILVCGTSIPHGFKVAGVKGYDHSFKQNVYVTVTDRATGKSSVKWLTSINPKKGKQTVDSACMVKLSDDRFAVLYTITNDKTGKSTLYYTAIDNSGKKLLTKKYANMTLWSDAQPVVQNGSIYWMNQSIPARTQTHQLVVYKIPAL